MNLTSLVCAGQPHWHFGTLVFSVKSHKSTCLISIFLRCHYSVRFLCLTWRHGRKCMEECTFLLVRKWTKLIRLHCPVDRVGTVAPSSRHFVFGSEGRDGWIYFMRQADWGYSLFLVSAGKCVPPFLSISLANSIGDRTSRNLSSRHQPQAMQSHKASFVINNHELTVTSSKPQPSWPSYQVCCIEESILFWRDILFGRR